MVSSSVVGQLKCGDTEVMVKENRKRMYQPSTISGVGQNGTPADRCRMRAGAPAEPAMRTTGPCTGRRNREGKAGRRTPGAGVQGGNRARGANDPPRRVRLKI